MAGSSGPAVCDSAWSREGSPPTPPEIVGTRPYDGGGLGGALEEEAGEVARLGDGEQDRVVAALAEGVEQADLDARVAGRVAADVLEGPG